MTKPSLSPCLGWVNSRPGAIGLSWGQPAARPINWFRCRPTAVPPPTFPEFGLKPHQGVISMSFTPRFMRQGCQLLILVLMREVSLSVWKLMAILELVTTALPRLAMCPHQVVRSEFPIFWVGNAPPPPELPMRFPAPLPRPARTLPLPRQALWTLSILPLIGIYIFCNPTRSGSTTPLLLIMCFYQK